MFHQFKCAVMNRIKDYIKTNTPIIIDYYFLGINCSSGIGACMGIINNTIENKHTFKNFMDTWCFFVLIGVKLPIIIPVKTYETLKRLKE
jgi:hypothetical protein